MLLGNNRIIVELCCVGRVTLLGNYIIQLGNHAVGELHSWGNCTFEETVQCRTAQMEKLYNWGNCVVGNCGEWQSCCIVQSWKGTVGELLHNLGKCAVGNRCCGMSELWNCAVVEGHCCETAVGELCCRGTEQMKELHIWESAQLKELHSWRDCSVGGTARLEEVHRTVEELYHWGNCVVGNCAVGK